MIVRLYTSKTGSKIFMSQNRKLALHLQTIMLIRVELSPSSKDRATWILNLTSADYLEVSVTSSKKQGAVHVMSTSDTLRTHVGKITITPKEAALLPVAGYVSIKGVRYGH